MPRSPRPDLPDLPNTPAGIPLATAPFGRTTTVRASAPAFATVDVDQVIEQSIAMAARILDSMRRALPGSKPDGGAPGIDSYFFSGELSNGGQTSVRLTWTTKMGDKDVSMGWSQAGLRMIDDMTTDLIDHLVRRSLTAGTPLPIVVATIANDCDRVIQNVVAEKTIDHLKIREYRRLNREWQQTRRDSEAEKKAEIALTAFRKNWEQGNNCVPCNEDGNWTDALLDATDEMLLRAQKIHQSTQKTLRALTQQEANDHEQSEERSRVIQRDLPIEEPGARTRAIMGHRRS